MKLARIGPIGDERPALRTPAGRYVDLSALTPDLDADFLASGGIDRVRDFVAGTSTDGLPELDGRVGSPVCRPGKIVCIGMNYADHAAESGSPPPEEPVVFLKAANTIVGPYDDVLIPRTSTATDWEVELGLVIGSTARYLDGPADGLAAIAGYTISHDVSERHFQMERGGQWTKGKSCDTFNPLGPWLVTPDEVGDATALDLRLWVDGELMQAGSTSKMIFEVGYLVWYLSQFMTLEPGDVINTGTPAGVALGRPDKPYLRAGQRVALEIDHLGRQEQVFREA